LNRVRRVAKTADVGGVGSIESKQNEFPLIQNLQWYAGFRNQFIGKQ
jgi:hypothetical protein